AEVARRPGPAGAPPWCRHPGRAGADPPVRRADQPLRRPRGRRPPARDRAAGVAARRGVRRGRRGARGRARRARGDGPAARAGRRPATELLEWQPVEASAEVAAELEVEPGAPVVMVRRLRTADGEPIALLTNYLPEHLAPPAEDLERTGLYECLRARGTQPAVARQRIGARVATAAEARALGEGARSAVLTAVRVAFDDAGRAIESGHHVYRASVYAFETTMFAR